MCTPDFLLLGTCRTYTACTVCLLPLHARHAVRARAGMPQAAKRVHMPDQPEPARRRRTLLAAKPRRVAALLALAVAHQAQPCTAASGHLHASASELVASPGRGRTATRSLATDVGGRGAHGAAADLPGWDLVWAEEFEGEVRGHGRGLWEAPGIPGRFS